MAAVQSAAAVCGAECYQIDDTWQQGEGLGRLINVNEHLTPAFWKIPSASAGRPDARDFRF